LDVLVNREPVDALSVIVHRDQAYARGQALVSRLKQLIPTQLFDIAIQASVGSRVIARANIKARHKDVLEKVDGGDVTRKRKLLEKQRRGKRRLKRLGNVQIPQEAFLSALKLGNETGTD
jgi:GTP-binding protein LepA